MVQAEEERAHKAEMFRCLRCRRHEGTGFVLGCKEEAGKARQARSSRMRTSRMTEQEFGIHLVANGEPGKVFEGRVTWPSVLKGGHFLLKKKEVKTQAHSGGFLNTVRSVLPP